MIHRWKAFWSDWHIHLTVLFTGLFLSQIAVFGSEFWLPETSRIVLLTLIFVLLLDAVFYRMPFVRVPLQAAAVLGVHLYALRGLLQLEPLPDKWRDAGDWLLQAAAQLHPYIWFGLAAWAIASVLWRLMLQKVQIIVIVIVTIMIMCVIDSFTPFLLWDQIALMIFAGLCLLVTNHFQELRVNNPASWGRLAEYPGSVLLPVILIISIVMAAGVLAPEVDAVLTDPYTAWQQYKGREVAFTTAKGRTITLNLSGSSESGYSRSDEQLGSGFDFDFSPVMEVTTTHKSYWRGEAKSFYTGEGWVTGPDAEFAATAGPLGISMEQADRDWVNTDKLESTEVHQTVRMLRDDVFPVLFGALSIDRVENIDGRNTGSAPKMRWVYAVSQLEWHEDADYPDLYRLVSLMPLVDEEGLRQVTNQSLSDEVREWYLQLPDGLPGRVAELAEEVTASSPTLYDKARALENYLKTNYAYDNKPDTSAGASEDFVDRFLFEIREGYCDYFSTAMVVMARSIGLPARWVKGFASGYLPAEIDPSGMTIPPGATDPDGAGTYLVRNADAHSWAEIYFEGYGWIPFEPTPGFSMPYAFPEGEELPEWVTAAVPAANDNPPSEEKSRVSSAWWMAAAAAVILAALGFVAFRSRKVLRRWYGRNVPETDRNRRVVYEVERLFRYLGRKGLRREEHETVRETMLRWEGSHRWLKGDLERLFDLFEKAKYGKGQISEEEMHVVLGKVQKLREELR